MRKAERPAGTEFPAGMVVIALMAMVGCDPSQGWGDTTIDFGKSVVVGNLRITPVALSVRDLGLRRASTPPDVQSVPLRRRQALVLELENVSDRDTILADVFSHRLQDDLGNMLSTTLTNEDWIVEGSDELKRLKPGGKAKIILGAHLLERGPGAEAASSFEWTVRLRVASDPQHEKAEVVVTFPKEKLGIKSPKS